MTSIPKPISFDGKVRGHSTGTLFFLAAFWTFASGVNLLTERSAQAEIDQRLSPILRSAHPVEHPRPETEVGMQVGVVGTTSLADKMVGVFFTTPLWGGLSLQPEFNYVQQSAGALGFGYPPESRLSYLQAPLLLKLRAEVPLGPWHPFVKAGPQVAYLIEVSAPPHGIRNSPRPASRTDLRFEVGAGAECDLSQDLKLDLTAIAYLGLLDFQEWRNSACALTLGLVF